MRLDAVSVEALLRDIEPRAVQRIKVPSVMSIEVAASTIQANRQDPASMTQLTAECEEFQMLSGTERAHMAVEFGNDAMLAGYLIGLYTARA